MNRPTSTVSFVTLLAGLTVTLSAQNPLRFEELPRRELPADSHDTGRVELVDLDGDGDLDAVLAGSPLLIYRNDGTGLFADVTATSMPAGIDGRALLGDVDGDGDLDMVVGATLLSNDGAGVFTAGLLPSGANARGAFGDVDGDGDLDLAVGGYIGSNGYGGAQNRLFLNDGTGTFVEVTATQMPVDNDNTAALAFGDVDGDGDLDLVCGNGVGFMMWTINSPQRDRLYLNDGAGTFLDATVGRLPLDTTFTTIVAFADVDLDNDLDLVMAGEETYVYPWIGGYPASFRVCTNDGAGAFTVQTQSAVQIPQRYSDLAVGDVDEDGDLDIVYAIPSWTAPTSSPTSYLGEKHLLLNDGSGGLTDVSGAWLPSSATLGESAGGVALGDVDGDGDLDLLCGNGPQSPGFPTCVCIPPGPQNTLYLNLRRQLNARTELRIGQTWTLDAYLRDGQAAAGAFAVPFVSLAPASIALPPYGTIGIDPAQAVALPLIQISATTGDGSLNLPIANVPGLIGTVVYSQALLVPNPLDAKLTNVAVDTVAQ